MKRMLAYLLLIVMIISMAACDKKSQESTGTTESDVAEKNIENSEDEEKADAALSLDGVTYVLESTDMEEDCEIFAQWNEEYYFENGCYTLNNSAEGTEEGTIIGGDEESLMLLSENGDVRHILYVDGDKLVEEVIEDGDSLVNTYVRK